MLRRLALLLLGIFFIAAGANHFVHPGFYVRIVPSYLPDRAWLVAVSGFFECLGGAGVLLPPARRVAAAGLILLLIAVFPANVEMAIHADRYADIASAAVLYARLPLQLVLIAWVWWAADLSRNSWPIARAAR